MSDDDDKEFDQELIRQIWRADPWNRYGETVDMLRLIAWLIRLVVWAFQSVSE